MTTAVDLLRTFEPEARRAFSFLEDDYGFRLRDVQTIDASWMELTYMSDRVAVVVLLEMRPLTLAVGLVDFPEGQAPAVPSAQMIGLNEIMQRRGSTAPAIVDRSLVPQDLPMLLDKSAAALREYAEPALRGDTRLLEHVRASRYE